jgi:hypothetical protein
MSGKAASACVDWRESSIELSLEQRSEPQELEHGRDAPGCEQLPGEHDESGEDHCEGDVRPPVRAPRVVLLVSKTKRDRELRFAAGIGALEIARSERAEELYARTWKIAAGPRPRRKAVGLARKAAARIKR